MKKLIIGCLTVSALMSPVFCAAPVTPVWRSTGGPDEPSVAVMSIDKMNGALYAGTNRGEIFRRADGQNTWTAVHFPKQQLETRNVYSFAQCGGELIAGVGYPFSSLIVECGGNSACYPQADCFSSECLLFSTNNGTSWDLDTLTSCSAYTVDNDTLFGLKGGILYRRIALSRNWERIGSLTTQPTPKPNGGFSSTGVLFRFGSVFVAAFNTGIFRSENNGVSWSKIGNTELAALSCVRCNSTLLVANSSLYRSIDTGKTWIKIRDDIAAPFTRNFDIVGTASLHYSNGVCHVTTKEGELKSPDAGTTWSKLNPSPVLPLCYYNEGTSVYAGDVNIGIITQKPGTTAWTDASDGLPHHPVFTLGSQNDTLITPWQGYHDSSWCFTPFAASWDLVPIRFLEARSAIARSQGRWVDQGTFIMLSDSIGVEKSLDSGKTWTECDSLIPYDGCGRKRVNGIVSVNAGIIASTTLSGLYITTTSGAYWKPIQNPLQVSVNHPSLLAKKDSSLLFAIFRTGWTDPPQGETLAVSSNGLSWTIVSVKKSWTGTATSLKSQGKDLIVGTTRGVFVSSDSGKNWQPIGEGLPEKKVTSLCITENYVFAALDSSFVYRLDRSSSVGKPAASSVVESSGLTAEVSAGCLRYSVPRVQHLRIDMLGLDGRLMAVLFDGTSCRGTHTLPLSVPFLSDRVALLRISGEHFKKVLKLNTGLLARR
jgi:hypothetical protein